MLTLYFGPGGSSMAPHIALHETGLPFEGVPISFAQRQHRTPAFLALNPEGKVPVLVAGAEPLTEVAAILYYLARRAPAARLWPEGDLESEAQALSWMCFIASTLHPARRGGIDQVHKVYGIAEARLGARAWAIGRYSVADIHLFRLYWRMRNSLRPEPDRFPALEAHYRRMMERPAVRRTIEIEQAIGYELPA